MGDIIEDWDKDNDDSFLQTDESMKDLDIEDENIYNNLAPKEKINLDKEQIK